MSEIVDSARPPMEATAAGAQERTGRKLFAPALGGVLLLLFLACALLPGTIAPYDPNHLDYLAREQLVACASSR